MAAQEQVGALYSFALIETAALVPHEQVDQDRLLLLVKQIARDGALYSPVMVDRSSMVILDGHHRVSALKLLGCDLTPVYLVDYRDPSIRVTQWREDVKVSKQSVVEAGLQGSRTLRGYPGMSGDSLRKRDRFPILAQVLCRTTCLSTANRSRLESRGLFAQEQTALRGWCRPVGITTSARAQDPVRSPTTHPRRSPSYFSP